MADLDELRERVHGAASWPQPKPGAGAAIRRSAARRSWRNRVATIGGVVVTVGAMSVLPTTLGGMFGGNRAAPPANSPTSEGSLGVADGYRPVGALGLVFEVPATWGTNKVACDGSPAEDTVAFGSGRDCLVPNPPRVSSLLVTTDANFLVSDALAQIKLSSAQVGSINVEESEPELIDGLWTFAVANSAGSVVVLRAEDEAVARHAHDALREIPSGFVTIPRMPGLTSDEVSAQLIGLGLVPEVRNVLASDLAPGDVVGVNPPVGAIVKLGQGVEVLRADGTL